LATNEFDWSITQKEKTMEAPLVPPPWITYIGERRTTFAKADGTKMRCYGELFGVGTWELFALTPPPKGQKKSLHGQ